MIRTRFSTFWSRQPALFFGFSFFLGTAFAFYPRTWLIVAMALLSCTARSKYALFTALFLFIFACATTPLRHPKITLPVEKIEGTGHFHIEEIKIHSSPFNRSILYNGTLRVFQDAKGFSCRNLPCQIYLPLNAPRIKADKDYTITGTLLQKQDYSFVLKPHKMRPWVPHASSFNLSEIRFQAKQKVSNFLKKHIKNSAAFNFLNALCTGTIDERMLSMEFGKIGLQHILAISGFHFALAALFLNAFFRLFFSRNISLCVLLFALTLYALFLGNAPSIQRAYIAIVLIAFGQLFSLRITGLNALGLALLIELLIHPLNVTQLGFQLTFLCTLSILLFYPLVYSVLIRLLPERSFSDVQKLSAFDQCGYVIVSLLRKTLAINCSVHLICLPIFLHLFHKFPLLSLIYNLFFPPCVCVSMLLLFLAFLFMPIPWISHVIFSLNNTWTSALLQFTSNPPAALDFSLRAQNISFSMVALFLLVSIFCGIFFYENKHVEKKYH